MKIEPNMPLPDLAERMGNVATELEAVAMRDLLVDQHDGEDTADISEVDWLLMLNQVAA